jgi:hypothetical protein
MVAAEQHHSGKTAPAPAVDWGEALLTYLD